MFYFIRFLFKLYANTILSYSLVMLIGELSEKSGFSRDSIRYYEKIGLIRLARRNRRANNYKEYSLEILQRLETIKQLKHFGFTLTETAELLNLMDAQRSPCEGLPKKLDEKISGIEDKINQLESFKTRLEWAKSICTGSCANIPSVPECLEAKS